MFWDIDTAVWAFSFIVVLGPVNISVVDGHC